jgi:hypothetical protein
MRPNWQLPLKVIGEAVFALASPASDAPSPEKSHAHGQQTLGVIVKVNIKAIVFYFHCIILAVPLRSLKTLLKLALPSLASLSIGPKKWLV